MTRAVVVTWREFAGETRKEIEKLLGGSIKETPTEEKEKWKYYKHKGMAKFAFDLYQSHGYPFEESIEDINKAINAAGPGERAVMLANFAIEGKKIDEEEND